MPAPKAAAGQLGVALAKVVDHDALHRSKHAVEMSRHTINLDAKEIKDIGGYLHCGERNEPGSAEWSCYSLRSQHQGCAVKSVGRPALTNRKHSKAMAIELPPLGI